MSKIKIDDLPFEGAELTEAQLGQVAGGLSMEIWQITGYKNGKACEWERVA
ncbi:putative ATP-grasp target RiPP [Streptosporangium sp. NPDC002607]